MMVQVGFWQDALTWLLPSTTNRFFTSWDCWCGVSTDVSGIVPHARGAQLVDRPSLGEDVPVVVDDLDPGLLEDLAGGVGHVRGHLLLVVAELEVEAQHGHSPPVLDLGVDAHRVLVAGQHLAEAAHADGRSRVLAHHLLVGGAEAGRAGGAGEHAGAGGAFEPVAAHEVLLLVLQVAEAGHVEAAGPPVVEGAGLAHEVLHEPVDPGTHHVLAEVVSDVAAGVADAVWVRGGLRVQEEPRRLQRGGAHHHDPGPRLHDLAGGGVDEGHSARLARRRIHRHLARDRARAHEEVARLQGRIDEAGGRVEGGVDVAAARAAVAGAASEAAAAELVVLEPVRGHARAIGRQHLA